MNRTALEDQILQELLDVVPEVDAAKLDPKVSFRDQFDMDSIDFLNFVLRLEKQVGIKIPDVDYPRLSSLDGCLSYLEARFAQSNETP